MGKDVQAVWADCMQRIHGRVSAEDYELLQKFVVPWKLEEMKEGVRLVINVPTEYFHERLNGDVGDTNLAIRLRDVMEEVLGTRRFGIGVLDITNRSAPQQSVRMFPSTSNEAVQPQRVNISPVEMGQNQLNPFVIAGTQQVMVDPHLDLDKSFDNFVEGKCNEDGCALARKIVQSERPRSDPLYIYGASGLGKTHLAQSIGIAIRERYPNRYVLYVPAKTFMREFTDAIVKRDHGYGQAVNEFTNFYSSLHVLILDDIHELRDKRGTQDMLQSIFNYLLDRKCLIIFTSLYKLVELKGFREELLSRFKFGGQIHLKQPSKETRLAIIRHYCDTLSGWCEGGDASSGGRKRSREEEVIPEEVLELIADRVRTNVRELIGVCNAVIGCSVGGRQVTKVFAEEIITSTVMEASRVLTFDLILHTVCEYYHLEESKVLSKDRHRELATARQMVMYFASKYSDLKPKDIAARIHLSRSVVLHGIDKIEDGIAVDRQIALDVEHLKGLLVGGD